jgi:DNA adenine methylase
MSSYFGSKATTGLCQPIIALMPPHDTYIETHRFLAEYDYQGGELVYSDPPYLHHTRSSGRRYRFDYEVQDHIELLALLKSLPCNVILSGYPSALYEKLLLDWRSLELQVMNQAGVRTEKLWFNFTPDRVHWPRYAGKNFTDRQRIKRKAANWGRQYRAMPPAERLAVLSSIMAVEAGEPA